MDINTTPTKSNLRAIKSTVQLSKRGYELMDKKRSILIKEIMELSENTRNIHIEVENVFAEAYAALQRAVVELGMERVDVISRSTPTEESIVLKMRSVMGVSLPAVLSKPEEAVVPPAGFTGSTSAVDEAYIKFMKVKELVLRLAVIENTAYRLSVNIKKTSKRANALKNITIPKYETLARQIQNTLEERERDEFVRLKVVKASNADI